MGVSGRGDGAVHTHTVQAGETRVPPVAGDLHFDCSKAPGWLVLEQSQTVAAPPPASAPPGRGALEGGNFPISQVWEWSPREGHVGGGRRWGQKHRHSAVGKMPQPWNLGSVMLWGPQQATVPLWASVSPL